MSDQKTGFGIDLDALEDKAKHQLKGPCTGMAREVLELVAELRKAMAAQEWIAQTIVCRHDACAYPCKCGGRPPCEAECVKCWLEAARDAVEEQKP